MLSSSPPATHDSLMFELDDEDTNVNSTATPNAHEFLNFSRRITERSLKRPVDTQVGIAYGRDLLFSQRNKPLKNAVKISSPLVHTNAVNSTVPVHTNNNINHSKIIHNKTKPFHHHQKVTSPYLSTASTAASSPQQSQNTAVISKSSSLDELVADVLNYMESCPDQSAYSYDLAILKPKLEAISSDKTR